ncbi:MAG: hypothetical protein GY863_13875 [bacterium]|nr:hypothetical protein [bacterium]
MKEKIPATQENTSISKPETIRFDLISSRIEEIVTKDYPSYYEVQIRTAGLSYQEKAQFQKIFLSRMTPKDMIATRAGRNGKTFRYVPVQFYKNMLFKLGVICSISFQKPQPEPVKLNGRVEIEAFAMIDLTFADGSEQHLESSGSAELFSGNDIGDARKAAESDATKKALSSVMFTDIYIDPNVRTKLEPEPDQLRELRCLIENETFSENERQEYLRKLENGINYGIAESAICKLKNSIKAKGGKL